MRQIDGSSMWEKEVRKNSAIILGSFFSPFSSKPVNKKNQNLGVVPVVNQDEAKDDLAELVTSEAESTKLVEDSEEHLIAVPTETIPLNIALPCSIYIKVADRYPLFRKQGERLTSRRVISLSEKGASCLYIHKTVWKLFIGSLEKSVMDENAPKEVVAQQIRGLIVAYGTELEKKIKEPKKPMFEKLRFLSEVLCNAIRRDPSIGASLLRKSSDPLVYFVNHAVNSAVYATVIGTGMKMNPGELKLLTYAALVHDVGNLYLPKTLLYKKGDLTEEETQMMQTHTRKGAELLQTFGSTPAVVLAALQHHERMDGEGYPQQLDEKDIHVFARVIAIADTYDALTSNKPYQPALTPKDALEKMKTLKGKFDTNILKNVTGDAGVKEFAVAVPRNPKAA